MRLLKQIYDLFKNTFSPPSEDIYHTHNYNTLSEPTKTWAEVIFVLLYMFVTALILTCILLFCTSCHTQKQLTKNEHKRDSTSIQNHNTQQIKHDSIFIRDSIYIKEYQKNDTVYKIQNVQKTQYITNKVYIHDTITSFIQVHDTIQNVQNTITEVKHRPTFLVVSTVFFWLLVLLAICYFAFKLYTKTRWGMFK